MTDGRTRFPSHSRRDVVNAARAWIGTPYHHQASTCGIGTDCLGLVRGVFRTLYGREAEVPPAYSCDWAEISRDETMLRAAERHLHVKPNGEISEGDVILFRIKPHSVVKHAGIATSASSMVHAMEGMPVQDVKLTRWWRRRIVAVFSFPGLEI